MSAAWLQSIRVATTPEAEDAVVELLTRVLAQPASIYQNLLRRTTRVSVFLPAGRATREQLGEVRAGLARLRECGIDLGLGRISVVRIRREDWADSWKRHFKPLEFGHALLVKPSWSKRPSFKGQAVVTLDPGLSFGTGQHATTSFCLSALVGLVRRRPADEAPPSFLDIGTGSGILAIAAAKLGFAPVHAFDFDPDAVRIAKGNARSNRVERKLRLWQADLTRLPRTSRLRFDLVCANLTADLLVSESRRILARCQPTGVMVLAGILDSQFAAVRAHYQRAGWRLIRTRREREWRSGVFVRRRPQ